MRLIKRGQVWFALFYENGRRVQRSTHCHDRKAAELCARQLERDGADPAHAAAAKATLSDALQLLLVQRREQAAAGRRSFETVHFYETKAGHLVRVLETAQDGSYVPFALASLQAAVYTRRATWMASSRAAARRGPTRRPSPRSS